MFIVADTLSFVDEVIYDFCRIIKNDNEVAANALRALGAVQQIVPIKGPQGVDLQYSTIAGETDRFTLKKDDLPGARSFLDIHSALKKEPKETTETDVLGALEAAEGGVELGVGEEAALGISGCDGLGEGSLRHG